MNALPMDDPATYVLLKSCKTTAVFQLESRGMKDLIRRLQPDRFEDIVALVALFRPGPLQSGMVDDFINRKHGRVEGPVDYLHPSLEPVLKPTYGVILYQEQVMQIAQVLAGYTLGGADLLRRAMGKKKAEEMAQQRSIFVDGAVARGVPEQQAAHIFDLMEKFAGYGFNKSHSAAYALLSFQTAYLKAHYPAAFMAAVLSADMDHTDKVVTLKDECDRMGLAVLAPDVNASGHSFEVADPRTVRYGLGAIKGVGQAVVDSIVAERGAHGPFTSLEDLCRRLDLNKLNRRVLEALIRSGSLDTLGVNRATSMARLPAAMQLGEQASRAVEAGQVDLFGLSAEPARAAPPAGVGGRRPGGLHRRVPARMERGDPARRGARDPRPLPHRPPDQPLREGPRALRQRSHRRPRQRPAGAVQRRAPVVRRQAGHRRRLHPRAAQARRAHLGDPRRSHRAHRSHVLRRGVPAVPRPDRQGRAGGGRGVAAVRRIQRRLAAGGAPRGRARPAARAAGAAHRAQLAAGSAGGAAGASCAELLSPCRPGPCGVAIRYAGELATAALELGPEWRVRATRALLEDLERLVGPEGVRVVYGPPAGSSSSAVG